MRETLHVIPSFFARIRDTVDSDPVGHIRTLLHHPPQSLISQTRQRLLGNPPFRAPYVKCLHDLHRSPNSPVVKRHLCKGRRSDLRPTDADVLEFLVVYWPEVWLTKDLDRMPRFIGDVGKVRPRDGVMHLSHGIAAQIVEKVKSFRDFFVIVHVFKTLI